MTASDRPNFPLGFGIRNETKSKELNEDTDTCEECDSKLIITHTGFQVCSECGLEHQLVQFTRF